MGLLDDAIREHLDLKRRRGADPAEVERAEREALGPVQRRGDVAAIADPDADATVDVDPRLGPGDDALGDGEASVAAYDQAHEEDDWALQEEAELRAPQAEPPPSGPDALEEEERVERPRSRLFGRRRQEPADDPPARDRREDPERPSALDDETSEYEVHDAPGEPADGEDVLEETPEFLQDTPDHARLWFAQRPPKDFDFDG